MIAAPAGFVLERRGPALVLLARDIVGPALAAGLDRPWEHVRPRPAGPGTGRGPRAFVRTPGGPSLLVKQHRRGGLLARLNPDRYFAIGRFVRELVVGRAARAAGLPVGEALGLVLQRAAPGWRAWGLARAIDDGQDVARWATAELEPGRASLWRELLALAERIHNAGLEHRDLNLGNILVRRLAAEEREFFVVDLDRARWWSRPVPARRRSRVVARLARSWRKVLGAPPPAA